ncbi:MAG: hypothetical protein WCT47_12315 [Betaproteobacteria bacterium]
MNNTADTFSALLRAHRSIRAFEPREIDPSCWTACWRSRWRGHPPAAT